MFLIQKKVPIMVTIIKKKNQWFFFEWFKSWLNKWCIEDELQMPVCYKMRWFNLLQVHCDCTYFMKLVVYSMKYPVPDPDRVNLYRFQFRSGFDFQNVSGSGSGQVSNSPVPVRSGSRFQNRCRALVSIELLSAINKT